jgi:hypothetical protein
MGVERGRENNVRSKYSTMEKLEEFSGFAGKEYVCDEKNTNSAVRKKEVFEHTNNDEYSEE